MAKLQRKDNQFDTPPSPCEKWMSIKGKSLRVQVCGCL